MPHNGSIMEGMEWWGYVQRVSKDAPRVRIAEQIDVTPSAISRWASGASPDPAKAAAFARAYGRPVLEAFIAAGFLTEQEAGQHPAAELDPRGLSDDELVAEVARRVKGDGRSGIRSQKKLAAIDGSAARGGRGSVSVAEPQEGDRLEESESSAERQDHPIGSPHEKSGVSRKRRNKRG